MANRWKLLFNGAVSGWRLLNFTSLSFDIYENKAARSGSYIKTPEKYSNPKCGLINIQNTDNKCFMWCMRYHQSPKDKNGARVSNLINVKDKYDYSEINYPVSLEDIKIFEENNKICIYVYEIKEKLNIQNNETMMK